MAKSMQVVIGAGSVNNQYRRKLQIVSGEDGPVFSKASSAAFRPSSQSAAHDFTGQPSIQLPSYRANRWSFALAKGFPEVSRHIANEAVNGHLRDAVPDHCVHGFSQRAEWWFVDTLEVQLCFSRC
jgi:hypothetical protein